MKRLVIVSCLFISTQSMALTVICDGLMNGKTIVSAQQYLRLSASKLSKTKPASIKQKKPGLPASSSLKAGFFDSYKLSDCQKFLTPFFVVGPDNASIKWLMTHRMHLRKVHALGFVTNIKTENDLKALDAISPINLIPTSVDGLARVIDAPSYPFFTNGCEVWQ